MRTIQVTDIRRGMILPARSTDPVITVAPDDEYRTVLVVHAGGYVWHGAYGDTVEVSA